MANDDPHSNDPPPARHRPAQWYRLSSASSLGIEIVVAVVFGVFAGRWLENNVTHWSPWTTLIGFFVGLGAAVNGIVRTAKSYKAELAAEAAEAAESKKDAE